MPTRTKRLPCGRTKAELAKEKKQLLHLLEMTEAAERGEVIEYRHSRVGDWMEEREFNPVEYSHLTYRVSKPKRGAK